MHTIAMAWNHKLKNALLKKGYGVTSLSEVFDVSPGTVSKWLTGINQPKYEVLLMLCKMGKIAPGFVLDDSQPDDGPTQIGEILSQEIARIGEREALALLLQATRAEPTETRVLRSREETHLEVLPQPKRHDKRAKTPGDPSGSSSGTPVGAGGPEQG